MDVQQQQWVLLRVGITTNMDGYSIVVLVINFSRIADLDGLVEPSAFTSFGCDASHTEIRVEASPRALCD